MASFIKRENEEETIRNRDLRKKKDEIEGKVSNLALFFFSKKKRFAFLYENGIESRLIWL